jgi:predicted transport protein
MEGLISGNKRTYDDFKKQITPQIKPLFDELRNYCFSLGKNVVEDVRMHRVVFGKSMTFRFFADIEPQRDSVLIKIRRDRKEPLREIDIKSNENLEQIKNLLLDAYSNIH